MKTKLPYGKIDLQKYWNAYMEREDAIRHLPSEKELEVLAEKSIVKERLTLAALPEEEPAQRGDTVTMSTQSVLPKFNKAKVTVSLGRGLYNKELETMAIGKKAGDSFSLVIQGEQVSVAISGIQRKTAPKPTDEMVAAMGVKDNKNQPITTVESYVSFFKEQDVQMKLANINYYLMEAILNDYPVTEYDEGDIQRLGELERAFFIRTFLEQEGIDLTREVPKSWEEDGVHSMDEFIAQRYEWYKMKIHQCLVYQNLLDVPDTGAFDPLDHYEVLGELIMKMFDLIQKKLEEA